MINITNIGIRQMLLASALVMAATGEASAQSASPEQPPSEATHFAQVDSSKLSTALNGKTLIPTIEIGYKASTANPAIINGHPAMFPVKTLIYPDGRENFRIEYGILHADANQHQSFKSGMRFQVTKVIIKDDCLELEIPMFTEGAILDKSFRGDVKFMFGKGWQSSMTTESVLQTVMRYLPDTETIAKAKAEAERVRAEEAEKARIAAETIAKAKAEAERVRAEEAEKARIAAEQPPSEANQAKSNVGGTGTNAGPLEAGYAAERRGDFQAAFLLYEPLAKQGNAKAQFQLGHMYHEGNGVPQDYVKALEWFRRAADQGNADAQINLGSMYYVGQVVLQDYAEALKLYRKAADQGNARAQKLITSLNLNEKTVEQQMAKSTVPVLPDPHLQHPKEARAALSFLERDLTISTDFAGDPEPGLASLQSINGGLCHLRCGFHLAVGFGEGGVQNSEFEFALSDINMETISYHKDAIGRAILSFDTSDGTPRFSRRDREMDMNQKVLSPWSEWEGTDKGLCRAKGDEDSLERDMKALAFLAKECGATPSPF